ncbi:MAG: hypothetical protein QXS37_03490 [Candidatus Aenigmatarchaeota archaeon]
MKLGRKVILGTTITTGFIFLVSITTLYVQSQITERGFCPIPLPVLVPAFASLGVFVGSLTYYLTFIKLEESEEKKEGFFYNLLEMLPSEEKNVIKMIIENKGEVLQSKISRSMGKVKTFRTIENLMKRGVVLKEKYGKTNKIKLSEKFRDLI